MNKEIASLINSPVALVFLVFFTLVNGLLLWILPGNYHVLEGSTASLQSFFILSPIILLLSIPALAMKSFAEEKKTESLNLLLSRPLTASGIILYKQWAIVVLVLIALLLSVVNLFLLYHFSLTPQTIDWIAIAASYASLLVFSFCIVSISVFYSSLTRNQVLAYLLAVATGVFLYYGIAVLASLFPPKTDLILQQYSLYYTMLSMGSGLLDSRSVAVLVMYTSLFFIATKRRIQVYKTSRVSPITIVLLVSVLLVSTPWYFRIDFTADKRYSLSEFTKQLGRQIEVPLHIVSYLDASASKEFADLDKALKETVREFQIAANGMIYYENGINSQLLKLNTFREYLKNKGIQGMAISNKKPGGEIVQKVVYPWVELQYKGRTLPVFLLGTHSHLAVQEALLKSIEQLEFTLALSIDRLLNPKERRIAFIEGHAELSQEELADITQQLSHYFSVDRGKIQGIYGELDSYDALIVAGPQSPFSEAEKFVLDQYAMQGKPILFFVNGVVVDYEQLAQTGQSPTMHNYTNLDDILFHYGIRINPVLLQDKQCLSLPVSVQEGETNLIHTIPWPYAPILSGASEHSITKGLNLVKTEFASTIDYLANDEPKQVSPLLLSSSQSNQIQVPHLISLANQKADFNKSFPQAALVVAALVEGKASSAFKYRNIPHELTGYTSIRTQTDSLKLLVVASEELIRNNPGEALGYDTYSKTFFDNASFITNSLLYLTLNEPHIQLQNKQLNHTMLNLERVKANTALLRLTVAVFIPVLFVLLLWFTLFLVRRKQ